MTCTCTFDQPETGLDWVGRTVAWRYRSVTDCHGRRQGCDAGSRRRLTQGSSVKELHSERGPSGNPGPTGLQLGGAGGVDGGRAYKSLKGFPRRKLRLSRATVSLHWIRQSRSRDLWSHTHTLALLELNIYRPFGYTAGVVPLDVGALVVAVQYGDGNGKASGDCHEASQTCIDCSRIHCQETCRACTDRR
jgi:hypothetical protein